MSLLKVESLVFRAGDKVILDGLDIAIGEREIHALLGANGTGKTTLAAIIMGCTGYAPTAGEIRFRGQDIGAMPIHERARLGITMAWQEPARFEGLRVGDYLRLGAPTGDPAQCLRRVGMAAEAYLDRALDKTLSGGERKRIELASILAQQPALAILDEPAAGIDILSMGEISEVIRSLKDGGGSVLLITHTERIVGVADRASYLCGGKIVLSGDPGTVSARYASRSCEVCNGKDCWRDR